MGCSTVSKKMPYQFLKPPFVDRIDVKPTQSATQIMPKRCPNGGQTRLFGWQLGGFFSGILLGQPRQYQD